MKSQFTWLAVFAAFGITGSVQAQPPAPGGLGAMQRPTYSPYLNLTRPGNSPGVNYYGLVRPQVQAQQNFMNLQGAVNSNQQQIGNLQTEVGGIPETGQGAGFMNYRGYFMNSGQSNVNQGSRFTNQNLRTPQPGLSGVNPGGVIRRR